MAHKTFVVKENDAGQRLDAWLVKQLSQDISRSRVQRHIVRGNVAVNDAPCLRAGYKIEANDRIAIVLRTEQPVAPQPERMPLHIVYEDDVLLVVNKPRGMLVHPDAHTTEGTLVHGVLAHAPAVQHVGELHRPGIVHRLDKQTTGLLVIAKQQFAYEALVAQFAQHKVQRVYQAVVHGVVSHDAWDVIAPIGRDPRNRTRMAVHPQGKPAHTRCRVLRRFANATLVEAELFTGRTHQIRVHMAHCGHPLVGDARYGGQARVFPGGQALHAWQLTLTHPKTKETVHFTQPLPADMQHLIRQCTAPSRQTNV